MSGFIAPDHAYSLGCLPVAIRSKLLAWKTAPAGVEPPGWEWLWEFESQGPNETLVRHTYDWSKVTDKKLLEKVRVAAGDTRD